ncbi:MAG: hypothetical protein ucyna2_01120 [Candidatus Atelocyanobacterium thalassa isolate SIO64986]|uniref:Uncharacterized protein n=1 Tax=Candidatus Atelocyanobacterium thalassa isolate SIO64986 TaxID=1527444 RepID=A0A086CFT9_9CHRO|nr:MAG: hypothetical protein ucyna2_01120 [Candidatus Atelocyanobacterium thalassa isolate SIO64986]
MKIISKSFSELTLSMEISLALYRLFVIGNGSLIIFFNPNKL